MKDEIERINSDFKRALVFEDKFSKFTALSEVEKDTSSADIPQFLKDRILRAITEQQRSIAGLLNREVNLTDLNSCCVV